MTRIRSYVGSWATLTSDSDVFIYGDNCCGQTFNKYAKNNLESFTEIHLDEEMEFTRP